MMNRLILASTSPRRKVLLDEAGFVFTAVDPPFDESSVDPGGKSPREFAESLAYLKADSARAMLFPDGEIPSGTRVLAADTIVSVNGKILGKPADEADARKMLRELSSSRHSVITGVAILGSAREKNIDSDVTYVTMRRMSCDELDAYIISDEWVGKAGAYAIQETADRFVTSVEGSFSNVVGLPMELVKRMLQNDKLSL